jgi:hypothetical protein
MLWRPAIQRRYWKLSGHLVFTVHTVRSSSTSFLLLTGRFGSGGKGVLLSLECDVVDCGSGRHKSCGPEGCDMVDTYESLNQRFPILDVVIVI